jgi:hypothetical protein
VIEKLLPGSSVDTVAIPMVPVEPVVVIVFTPGVRDLGEPVTVQLPLVAVPDVLGLRTTVKVPNVLTVRLLDPYVARVTGEPVTTPVPFTM